jgi:hypothetical protein
VTVVSAVTPGFRVRAIVDGPVNRLRDPFIFEDEGATYLVYLA